jgi:CheY-like chemotaxis protein
MKLKCIMLIDDNVHDTFFAKRVIAKNNPGDTIIAKDSAMQALDYLRSQTKPIPDMIFLDIYMPVMSGWEFLDEYCKLEKAIQNKIMIVMLATSGDPAHILRANTWACISDYITKPLTSEKMEEISEKYFKSYPAL